MNNSMVIITTVVIVIGIIALNWTAFRFYDPFELGINKARKDFPPMAEVLGLEFTDPETREGLGELAGVFSGYDVRVAPDDSAIIEISLHDHIKVHLGSDEPERSHANEGMDAFDFQQKAANSLFKTRFSSRDLVGNLASSQALFEFVEVFNSHWGREISDLVYSNGYVMARFRYGSTKYIPAKDIEPMLKDLVALAEILESL